MTRDGARAIVVLYDKPPQRCGGAELPQEILNAIDSPANRTVLRRGESLSIVNIDRDASWKPVRKLARENHIRACRAAPIMNEDAKALGAFVVTLPESSSPDVFEWEQLREWARIAGLAIERAAKDRESRERLALLATLAENIDQGVAVFDANRRLVHFNRRYQELYQFPDSMLRIGVSYEAIIRHLAERGEYGDIDVDEFVERRVADLETTPEWRNLRVKPNGETIAIYRRSLPDGGLLCTFTDVTAEIRAGEEARTKSELLQMTQDYISQGICVMDEHYRVTNFNRRWVEMFSLPPEIARIGTSLKEILEYRARRGDYGEGNAEEIAAERLVRAQNGDIHRTEHVQPNGSVITIRRTRLPNGGSIATYTDVTERWKAERESERKTQLLETVFQSLTQAIGVYGPDFRLLARNDHYAEFHRFPPDYPPIGTHYDDVIRMVAADGAFGDRDVEDVLKGFHEALAAQPTSTFEHVWPDGRVMVIHRSRMPNGGFVVALTDMTKMRLAERDAAEKTRLLELALSSMGQGFAIHDKDFRMVTCNEKYRLWRGNIPEELLAPGMPHHESVRFRARRGDFGPGDPEVHVTFRMEKMRNADVFAKVRMIDGRMIHAQRRAMPEGGCVTTYTDITDLKTVEAELVRARDVAEAANAAKTEFLANMSHELRTPLNAVIGFSELMRNEAFGPLGDSRYKDYCGNIADSGIHLLSLIDDILDLSKIEVGKMSLQEDTVEIGGVIETCATLVREQAIRANLALSMPQIDGLPRVRVDARKIKQVILNLLQNAIKFTPAGGRVSVEVGTNAEGDLTIAVSDTGIGMKEEDIPRALERFGQVEGTLSRRYNGAGLGLPLAKSLIELHGGTLAIASRPGEGTRVTVRLPKSRICAAGETVRRSA